MTGVGWGNRTDIVAVGSGPGDQKEMPLTSFRETAIDEGGGNQGVCATVVSAYVLIQTEMDTSAEVAAAIGAMDGVIAADVVTGPYDVIAKAEAETMDELGKLVISRMQMVPGITRTLSSTVVNLAD